MNILGLSALYHDSAAALCRGGEIVAAAQEERFSRIKNDASFPEQALAFCLEQAGLNPFELDAVVYYDNPLLTLDRWLANLLVLKDDSRVMLEKSFDSIFGRRLWVQRLAERSLGGLGRHYRFLVTQHHIAHAASAFYPSPFERAAILTLDGVGEWATTTIGQGRGLVIEPLREIDYPHSLGLLYSTFTYFCGFKVNSGDYKLMGLAPYGQPRYYELIRDHLINIKPDGSFRLNLEYFTYWRDTVMAGEAFADLFGGPPRPLEGPITRREMDLAASVQKVLEEAVILLAREARRLTGERYLVMAGGVALNCVANGKLLRAGIFDDLWVQPAAGDAGGALGAALYAAHAHFGCPRRIRPSRDSQKGSLLGPAYDEETTRFHLDTFKAIYSRHEKADLYARAAAYLAEGKVLGFFNGRLEFGPRALGSRSILADPRRTETQSRLNQKIKFRESFRPFAPAVLEEKAADYFDLDRPSPYMLFCAEVRPRRRRDFALNLPEDGYVDLRPVINQPRSDVPAVTHVDFSARVQTVGREVSPDFHHLLEEFEKLTGCPVLVNTSFNVRGEPIVCTPTDAYLCFMRTDLDALIIDNFLLLKEDQPLLRESADWGREHEPD